MNKYLAFFLSFILVSLLCGVFLRFLPNSSKANSVSVITTLHDREGLSESDFDLSMLSNNEKMVVDTCMQQTRQILLQENAPSRLNPYPISESHFITIDGRKLGIISIAVYSDKGNSTSIVRAIRIIGFTSKGIETVNCIRKGNDDFPAFTGECGEKIYHIFGVSFPK